MNDGWVTLLQGDALTVLRTLPDGAAQMCVTSPPYWGLRDYGTATWEGGDEACGHSVDRATPRDRVVHEQYAPPSGWTNRDATATPGDCKCGARRIDSQLGLEATPEEYVARMVAVFAEVRRVLRDDGTLWLNIGDSYAVRPQSRSADYIERTGGNTGLNSGNPRTHEFTTTGACKPKDLVGIPWMLAFALRADGWYLRSDIIWSKPNPMPESVTDRPTKAHEYLFLLSKRERYHYDADAIREAQDTADRSTFLTGDEPAGRYPKRYGLIGTQGALRAQRPERLLNPNGRNKRSVWTIATEPYPEAHFATFPTALVKPCILAGCPEGGTVLDPFAGSGTVLQVAKEFGRKSIGIELNPEYVALAERRLSWLSTPMRLWEGSDVPA